MGLDRNAVCKTAPLCRGVQSDVFAPPPQQMPRRIWTHTHTHTAGYCSSLWQPMAYCGGFYLYQSETRCVFFLFFCFLLSTDHNNTIPKEKPLYTLNRNIPARLYLINWFIVTLLLYLLLSIITWSHVSVLHLVKFILSTGSLQNSSNNSFL